MLWAAFGPLTPKDIEDLEQVERRAKNLGKGLVKRAREEQLRVLSLEERRLLLHLPERRLRPDEDWALLPRNKLQDKRKHPQVVPGQV